MKNVNFKSLFFSLVLLSSLVSFIHVNSSAINIVDTTPIVKVGVEVNEAAQNESKLPDLKIIKFVISIVGKFTTAK
jgi:hypothetical protein